MSVLNTVCTSTGLMMLLIESTNRMLKIFDPMTLPMAISLFFFKAATIDVNNSGSEVPAATMVNP